MTCRLSLLFALIVGLAHRGVAEPPPAIKELIAQMRIELQADMKAARDDERGIDRQWQLSSMLLQIERSFDEDAEFEYDLKQIVPSLLSYAASEKMQQLVQALTAEAGREFAAREKAALAEIDKLIETNVTPGIDAKTAAELDAPLAALQKSQGRSRYRRESRGAQSANQRLSSAISFLTHWQDYLAAKETGRMDQARSALSNLTSSGREYSFVPRSRLLALANSLKGEPEPPAVRVEELLARIEKLDDLPVIEAELRKLPYGGSNGVSPDLMNAVRSLALTYTQIKAGRAASLNLPSRESLLSAGLDSIREKVFAFALPRILLLDDADGLRPGESAVSYLGRKLAEAQKREDWALVGRIGSTSRSLNLLEGFTGTNDSSALSQFLAGLNQETAKQYSLAVASYQGALKTGSRIVPPELIGEHLEKIREAHPKDFERGVELALNPPMPDMSDPRYRYRGYPFSVPPGFGSETTTGGRYTIGPDGRPVPMSEATTVTIPPKASPAPGTPAPKPDKEPAK